MGDADQFNLRGRTMHRVLPSPGHSQPASFDTSTVHVRGSGRSILARDAHPNVTP